MFPRHIQPLIEAALADTPVVLINGARQTGKSTLVQAVSQNGKRRYLTLDDRAVLAAAKSDPTGFIAGLEGNVAIDEVQRAPELFLDIKASVDHRREAGRFLLTGSANVLLLPTLADSLAGRMEVLSLWPLSSAEMAGIATANRVDWLFDGDLEAGRPPPCDRDILVAALLRGGFPEATARHTTSRRAAWFESYLQTILQRDVRDLSNIEQLTEVPNLLQQLAGRSAGLLNFAELSRDCGLTQTTLKRYFSLLETLFLIVRVPAWARNPLKRLVKSPKLFLPDCGLLAWLRDLSPAKIDSTAGLPGALLETYVAGELLKHLAFSGRGLTLWHYRTQSDIEVDFLLEDRLGGLVGIEVKAAASISSADFKSLRHLRDSEQERFRRGIVLYAGREVIPFSDRLYAVPLSLWWT